MWIVMNNAFMSIVNTKDDPDTVAVRARLEEDLIAVFPEHANEVITTDDSDYRFRLILDKKYVADVVAESIVNIDYTNFKNSVKEKWRYRAYTQIWSVMYKIQEAFHPNENKWWLNYRR